MPKVTISTTMIRDLYSVDKDGLEKYLLAVERFNISRFYLQSNISGETYVATLDDRGINLYAYMDLDADTFFYVDNTRDRFLFLARPHAYGVDYFLLYRTIDLKSFLAEYTIVKEYDDIAKTQLFYLSTLGIDGKSGLRYISHKEKAVLLATNSNMTHNVNIHCLKEPLDIEAIVESLIRNRDKALLAEKLAEKKLGVHSFVTESNHYEITFKFIVNFRNTIPESKQDISFSWIDRESREHKSEKDTSVSLILKVK